jgi:hypothetical protein
MTWILKTHDRREPTREKNERGDARNETDALPPRTASDRNPTNFTTGTIRVGTRSQFGKKLRRAPQAHWAVKFPQAFQFRIHADDLNINLRDYSMSGVAMIILQSAKPATTLDTWS